MRKLLAIALVSVFLTTGCIASLYQLIRFTDKDGNRYSLILSKDDTKHEVNATVTYLNKTYHCEVIHTKDNISALDIEVDLSLLDKTGKAYIGYKGNRYGCEVSNEPSE